MQAGDVKAAPAGGAGGDPDAAPVIPDRPRAQLAAASRTMLNQFVDELRAEPKVDLSGKNLMDEGVAFVAEGLAYNQTCRSARFASNGIGSAACFQLAEVLKVPAPISSPSPPSALLPCSDCVFPRPEFRACAACGGGMHEGSSAQRGACALCHPPHI